MIFLHAIHILLAAIIAVYLVLSAVEYYNSRD